ncbi:MAG: hypothetical protein GY863_14285, partial [bacterium]|nr:hypothetical protein [bacterium]
ILDRILANPKSTVAAIVGAVVGGAAIFGLEIDPTLISSLLLAIITIIGLLYEEKK